ncbi:MAG TPA: hypothetical protein EYQ28_12145, partial [Henriciella sp.]|nr:hypothetical protein [Henriciella sp.]
MIITISTRPKCNKLIANESSSLDCVRREFPTEWKQFQLAHRKVSDAVKITGSMTRTSKMPGLSYSLPAWECQTGAKLR